MPNHEQLPGTVVRKAERGDNLRLHLEDEIVDAEVVDMYNFIDHIYDHNFVAFLESNDGRTWKLRVYPDDERVKVSSSTEGEYEIGKSESSTLELESKGVVEFVEVIK